MNEDVTHREIYERLIAVEAKVDTNIAETKTMVAAFNAVEGAFVVLSWIASIAKPLLWVTGVITAFSLLISEYRK